MLWRCEIVDFHRPLVEMPQIGKYLKVACFTKSEIVRVDTEHIVHEYPFVLADPFPHIWSLASAGFCIGPLINVFVTCMNTVRKCHADTSGLLLSHVHEAITPIGRGR